MRFLWKSQIERGRKAPPKPEKKTRRRVSRRKHLPALFLLILWVALFGTLGHILFFSPFLLIDPASLSAQGTQRLSEERITGFARENISGRWLGILPKNNFLLLRPDILEERLLFNFPLIRSVEVSRIFPHGLRIWVEEREKIILWCSGGPCYLITETGIATEARPALAEENREFVRTLVDTSAQPARLGQRLFSFDVPGFVSELERLFAEELGIRIILPYETASRFADELRFQTAEGFRLYVSTDRRPSQTVAALRLLFEKELTAEARQKLEYIDARAENRMYYLMKKNEESLPEASSGEEAKDDKKKKE